MKLTKIICSALLLVALLSCLSISAFAGNTTPWITLTPDETTAAIGTTTGEASSTTTVNNDNNETDREPIPGILDETDSTTASASKKSSGCFGSVSCVALIPVLLVALPALRKKH